MTDDARTRIAAELMDLSNQLEAYIQAHHGVSGELLAASGNTMREAAAALRLPRVEAGGPLRALIAELKEELDCECDNPDCRKVNSGIRYCIAELEALLAAPVASAWCIACEKGDHQHCLGGQCECIHASPVASAEEPCGAWHALDEVECELPKGHDGWHSATEPRKILWQASAPVASPEDTLCGCGWEGGLRRYCDAHNPCFITGKPPQRPSHD